MQTRKLIGAACCILAVLYASVPAFAVDVQAGVSALQAGNHAQALRILVPLANVGNDEAQRLVGEMSYNGQGMKRDLLAAFKWNEVSASNGNRIAQYNLGYLYERGDGVPASRSQAMAWYTKSALQDYAPAQHRLGDLYVASDREKAIYWYDRARRNGDEAARKKLADVSSEKFAQLRAERERDEAEEREKARVEAERQRAEDEARRRREARESESIAQYNAAMIAQIQRRGAEDAALLSKIDRQTQVAVAEAHRALANQAVRERSRAEDADRRRETERSRVAGNNATAPQPEPPRYQSQVVVVPSGPASCPPGSSPARHSNGQTIAVPAVAYCVKDTSGGAASNHTQTGGGIGSGSVPAATPVHVVKSDTAEPNSTRMDWGPLQREAMAICNLGKNGKWRCDGPVQLELLHDSPSIEAALRGQQCQGGTPVAGGPVINGERWDAFRCNHAIGYGDRDIGAKYGLAAMQRAFMCPKGQLGDGRCATFYDGQDKQ